VTVHVVVMGVAGCGKSAVGALLASELGLPFIEGDSFHPAGNVAKMRQGLPLTDADRAGWLARLGEELRAHPGGAVLTCSALKRAYRDTLRAAAPGLRFVYLQVTPEEAAVRVAARSGHFYPASLVDSQFEALQEPQGEEGVCTVGAGLPVEEVARAAARALARD
jgi:gluconokinase